MLFRTVGNACLILHEAINTAS